MHPQSNYEQARRYNYSENAVVWCASGYQSQKYKNLHKSLLIPTEGDENG